MAISVLQCRIEQAERHLVDADRYEEAGDLRFSRQAARHAAGWFSQAAHEAAVTSLSRSRDLLLLAESNYIRGRSPVYVRKMRARIEAVELEIEDLDAINARWEAGQAY